MRRTVTLELAEEECRVLALLARRERTTRTAVARNLLGKALREHGLDQALTEYRMGKLTFAQAAKTAGVTKRRMLSVIRKRKMALYYEDVETDPALARLVTDRKG